MGWNSSTGPKTLQLTIALFFTGVLVSISAFCAGHSPVRQPASTDSPYLVIHLKRLSPGTTGFRRVVVDTVINPLEDSAIKKELLNEGLGSWTENRHGSAKLYENASLALTKNDLGTEKEFNLQTTVSYEAGFLESPTVYGVKDHIRLSDLVPGRPTRRVYRISSSETPNSPTLLVMEITRKF